MKKKWLKNDEIRFLDVAEGSLYGFRIADSSATNSIHEFFCMDANFQLS